MFDGLNQSLVTATTVPTASVNIRVGLASFHLEYQLSGESESVRNLAALLGRVGVAVTPVGFDAVPTSDHSNERIYGKARSTFSIAATIADVAKDVDLIHLCLPTPALGWIVDRVTRNIDKPLIVRFDSQWIDGSAAQWLRWCCREPLFYLPRLLINNSVAARLTRCPAAAYVVSTDYQAAQLRRVGYPEDRVHVIPNAIDDERFRRQPETVCRPELPPSPVIAYIGHLFHVKGVAALLRAMTAHPDLNLVIADSGLGNKAAVQWHVRKLGISDRVRFLGRVDVPGLLRAVDALVLPYRAGFGTVVFPNLLLEAIAVGVPVVSSDVPVVRELFGSSAAVVLAEPEDSDSLAVAIGRALASDRGAVSAAQMQLFAELQPRQLAARTVELYEDVLNG